MAVKKLIPETGRSTACRGVTSVPSPLAAYQPRRSDSSCRRSSSDLTLESASPIRAPETDENLPALNSLLSSGLFDRANQVSCMWMPNAINEHKTSRTADKTCTSSKGDTWRQTDEMHRHRNNDVTKSDLADISRITTASFKLPPRRRASSSKLCFEASSTMTMTSLLLSPSSRLNSTFDYPLHSTRFPDMVTDGIDVERVAAAADRRRRQRVVPIAAPSATFDVQTRRPSTRSDRPSPPRSVAEDVVIGSDRRRRLASIVRTTLFTGQLKELLDGSTATEDEVSTGSARRSNASAMRLTRLTAVRSRVSTPRAIVGLRARGVDHGAALTSSTKLFPIYDEGVGRCEPIPRPSVTSQVVTRHRPPIGRRRPEAIAVAYDFSVSTSQRRRQHRTTDKKSVGGDGGERLKRLPAGSLVRQIGTSRLIASKSSCAVSVVRSGDADYVRDRKPATRGQCMQRRRDADRKRRIREFRRESNKRGRDMTENLGLKFMGFV